MFVRQGLGCFQLDDEAVIHEQVSVVVTNEGAVLVIDFEWILLFRVQAQLPEPMGQRVLIDLFQVAVLVVAVNREPRFPDHIAQFHNIFHS
jgi:hypothetical protein